MAVGEGKFVLYSRIEPPLEAGDYRFTAHQSLNATGHTAGDLPVAELPTYVTVRSPRFTMPPDQILSTYPPAGSEGSYGARLPQVVIKRRTLPWERSVQQGVPRSTPWLALVLIAEGEAELTMNQPVAQCVTPGVALPGKADTELGNYLQIRKSVVDRVFPTQLDMPLLAHAREVDIHDTELMMGDDDGFLAVVIANRLPLSHRDEHGVELPAKYLACLINLEGQFSSLLERAPAHTVTTHFPVKEMASKDVNLAVLDHASMGTSSAVTAAPGFDAGVKPYAPKSTWAVLDEDQPASNVYTEMARDFSKATVSGFVAGTSISLDPTLRFPVLLHWSFTSYGDETFRSLMEGLDSGLLGTTTAAQQVEVAETGHIGLGHRTRIGDPVRSWYRGPFVPHPADDSERLMLAHAADQLRIVVPDGREDISLAAAFEIGRLLALSRPSMIASLLRWRQTGYQTARRDVVWDAFRPFLDKVIGVKGVDAKLGVHLGRGMAAAVTQRPGFFLGNPRPLASPGRPLSLDGTPNEVLARGFGLRPEVFAGSPAEVLTRLGDSSVLRAKLPGLSQGTLTSALDHVVDRMAGEIGRVHVPPGIPGTPTIPEGPSLPGGHVPGGHVPGIPGIPGGPDVAGGGRTPGGPGAPGVPGRHLPGGSGTPEVPGGLGGPGVAGGGGAIGRARPADPRERPEEGGSR